MFLARVGVEVDTGRDEDAEDQDKEHDLIEKCPPAQHSASLALEPVRIHYNILPKVKKAGGAAWDPGGAQRDLLRFAEREHVRVMRRQDPLSPFL